MVRAICQPLGFSNLISTMAIILGVFCGITCRHSLQRYISTSSFPIGSSLAQDKDAEQDGEGDDGYFLENPLNHRETPQRFSIKNPSNNRKLKSIMKGMLRKKSAAHMFEKILKRIEIAKQGVTI